MTALILFYFILRNNPNYIDRAIVFYNFCFVPIDFFSSVAVCKDTDQVNESPSSNDMKGAIGR